MIDRGALALPDNDPHALVMEELAGGKLTSNQLFELPIASEPATAYAPEPTNAAATNGHAHSVDTEADDMEAVLKALVAPMTSKALAKHLNFTDARIAKLLEHLVHLHKIEPPVGRSKSYKLLEPDLFSPEP